MRDKEIKKNRKVKRQVEIDSRIPHHKDMEKDS